MKTDRNSYEHSRQHVQERALERYGLTLSDKDYDTLCVLARSCKEIVSVEKNGDDVQNVLSIVFKGKNLLVVFSKKQDRVKTLLPARSET